LETDADSTPDSYTSMSARRADNGSKIFAARTHVEPEITPRNRSWARDIGISPCYQSWHNLTTFTETYRLQPVEASGIHPQTRKRLHGLRRLFPLVEGPKTLLQSSPEL